MPTDASRETHGLADYITTALAKPIPEDVAEKAKHHILDTLAAAISGSQLAAGQAAIRYIESQGGTPAASVVATNMTTTAINAAFANAMMAHADETDDTHQKGRLHPGATVVPVALAMAEAYGRDGLAMLRAVVLGYDVAVRVNVSLGPTFLLDKRHSTHSVGAQFGGTATAAALAGLDHEQTVAALSYCMQQAGGCPSYIRDKGHIEKAFDFNANAARNAAASAVMADLGFSGAEDPLSSPYGFYDVFTDEPNPALLVEELGTRYEILGAQIKKWPVGNPNMTPIESLTTLMAEHGLNAGNVAHVRVQLPVRRFDIANNSKMPDICTQHLLAVLLIDGSLTFATTHDAERMDDPAVLALRARVEMVANPELDTLFPMRPAIVDVTTTDGRTFSHRTNAAPGTPYNPMSRATVAAKALDLMATVTGPEKAKGLTEAIFDLEALGPVTGLRGHLRIGSP